MYYLRSSSIKSLNPPNFLDIHKTMISAALIWNFAEIPVGGKPQPRILFKTNFAESLSGGFLRSEISQTNFEFRRY